MGYSNGVWEGEYHDFDYLATDSDGNTVIHNQVDDGECWEVEVGNEINP
jgi:hypothetical protein